MSNHFIDHIAIVVLAAGQSKRLGSPKQLLAYKNESLLERSIESAVSVGAHMVLVVTGANYEMIEAAINNKLVTIIRNNQWQHGMSTSIKAAMSYLQKHHPEVNGLLVMVCDQPFASNNVLNELIRLQQESDLPIAASNYANRLGTPALFHKSIFHLLENMEGDKGARKILEENRQLVAALQFDEGEFDIDTMEDYNKLLTINN